MDIDTGIDMKELECFAYVVETNSFSQAAEFLNLKRTIQYVEHYLLLCGHRKIV